PPHPLIWTHGQLDDGHISSAHHNPSPRVGNAAMPGWHQETTVASPSDMSSQERCRVRSGLPDASDRSESRSWASPRGLGGRAGGFTWPRVDEETAAAAGWLGCPRGGPPPRSG